MKASKLTHASAYLVLFSNRDFFLLWIGQAFYGVAVGLHLVALPWLILEITGSSASVGFVMAGYTLAMPTVGLLGGVVSDRWNRRRVMSWSLAVSAALIAIIPFLMRSHASAVLEIAAVSFLLSSAAQFFEPALNASLARMVASERLSGANALMMSTRQVGMIIGPALGGTIIALTSLPFTFYFDSFLFVFAACAVSISAVPRGPNASPERRAIGSLGSGLAPGMLLADLKEAFAFMRTRGTLVTVIALGVLSNFALGPVQVVAPSFVQDVFGRGASGFGLLMASLSLGMILSMLVVGRLDQFVGKGPLILTGFLLAGLSLLSIALISGFYELVGLFFLTGCGLAAVNLPFRTVIQLSTPDHLLGKMLNLDVSLSMAAFPVSQMLFGILSADVRANEIFMFAGLLLIVCSAIGVLKEELIKLP